MSKRKNEDTNNNIQRKRMRLYLKRKNEDINDNIQYKRIKLSTNIYKCCIHDNNKDICVIYECDGIKIKMNEINNNSYIT